MPIKVEVIEPGTEWEEDFACPSCKHWIDIDVEVEYASINDMSAIITPIEALRSNKMEITKEEITQSEIQIVADDAESEAVKAFLTDGEITDVGIRRYGTWHYGNAGFCLWFAITHKAEFNQLIREVENVTK